MTMFARLAATAALALVSTPAWARAPEPVVGAIRAEETAAIETLRQWIALPTIANMNINHAEGADYMRRLALDAGFQQAKIIPTKGVPSVFATFEAVAPVTLGINLMYDVKHYDPAEWNSPPL